MADLGIDLCSLDHNTIKKIYLKQQNDSILTFSINLEMYVGHIPQDFN